MRLSLLGASAALAADLVLSACNNNTGSLANTPSSSGPQVLTAVHGHKGAFASAATAQTGYVGILGEGRFTNTSRKISGNSRIQGSMN